MDLVKKLAVIGVLVGIYQNWHHIDAFFTGTPEGVYTETDVVLYATDWCGYCEKTRRLFAKHNIPYVEFDIEKSKEGLKAYRALGGRAVPVIDINGTVIHGYSEQRIMSVVQPR